MKSPSKSAVFKEAAAVRNLKTARIIQNRPVANQQWALSLRLDSGPFESFELGNFCMLSLDDWTDPLAPRPFAIVERDAEGSYHFIYRTTGKFTRLLAKMQPGMRVNVLGPLGRGISKDFLLSGRAVFIAGGVGYASLLPLIECYTKQHKEGGHVFYGVRQDLEVIRKGSAPVLYASDDGSIGLHGRLPELLKQKRELWADADAFFICGPTGMMKAVHEVIPVEKSYYFLEETMGCGVGICVGCVVSIQNEKNEVKRVRSCMEGPIFKGSVLAEWKKS